MPEESEEDVPNYIKKLMNWNRIKLLNDLVNLFNFKYSLIAKSKIFFLHSLFLFLIILFLLIYD